MSKKQKPAVIRRELQDDQEIDIQDLPKIEAVTNSLIGVRPDLDQEVILDMVLAHYFEGEESYVQLGRIISALAVTDNDTLQ